jgi:hypothetical protein
MLGQLPLSRLNFEVETEIVIKSNYTGFTLKQEEIV